MSEPSSEFDLWGILPKSYYIKTKEGEAPTVPKEGLAGEKTTLEVSRPRRPEEMASDPALPNLMLPLVPIETFLEFLNGKGWNTLSKIFKGRGGETTAESVQIQFNMKMHEMCSQMLDMWHKSLQKEAEQAKQNRKDKERLRKKPLQILVDAYRGILNKGKDRGSVATRTGIFIVLASLPGSFGGVESTDDPNTVIYSLIAKGVDAMQKYLPVEDQEIAASLAAFFAFTAVYTTAALNPSWLVNEGVSTDNPRSVNVSTAKQYAWTVLKLTDDKNFDALVTASLEEEEE